MKKMRIFYIFLFAIIFFALLTISGVFGSPLGFIGIILDSDSPAIIIVSPLNVTYNFGIGANYTLQLNVSSTSSIQTFRYTLEDLKHDEIVYQNIIFTPNTTFDAVRWGNKLTVYGNLSNGQEGFSEVYFSINVADSAPLIANISSENFACEYSPFLMYVNVTNLDEDSLSYSLFPTNPIFPFELGKIGHFTNVYYLNSLNLSKSYVGKHSYNFSVNDGFYSDSRNFNVTVIEINRVPEASDIGVMTLYSFGANSSVDINWSVFDFENGYSDVGNLSFNVTFSSQDLFSIDQYGRINFTVNTSQLGVHNVTLCVNDTALSNIHPNISFCGVTGLSNTVCDNFSITVTNDNRAPTYLNYYPSNLSFTTNGAQDIYFNVSTYDPDYTVPDVYWYFDGILNEYDSGATFNQFSYSYPCDSYGVHNVSALITDGLENFTLQWNFTVLSVMCPVPPSFGSGGGGGGGAKCYTNLACDIWSTCSGIENSFSSGFIGPENYLSAKMNCSIIGLGGASCGYQSRSCIDINQCTRKVFAEQTFCQYIDNPSCEDNLKNCHDGSCEVLVDCGGPCGACSACSDGVQNQGEKGIDCGGPCPNACVYENPIIRKEELKYTIYVVLLILLLLLITLIIINIIRIVGIKREIGELNWYKLLRVR